MKIFFLSLLALLVASLPQSMAQNVKFFNVRQLERLDAFSTADHQVSGYYCFIEIEKAGQGKRAYSLELLDQDLKQTASSEFIEDKQIILLNAAHTGESVMLLFFNKKTRTYSFRQFNGKGEQTLTKMFTAAQLNPAFSKDAGQFLIGVQGKGYLHYVESPSIYSILFYPESNSPIKEWKVEQKFGKNSHHQVEYLAASEQILLSMFTEYSNAYRKDGQFSILGTDLNTGGKIFESQVTDKKHDLQITNGLLSGDSIYLFGLYYPKNSDVFADNSLGLCALTMDLAGNINARQYLSWATDVSRLLPTNDQGKTADIGHFFFHDFIKTADGKVFGIAESFRRNASALGIASAVLLGSGNLTKTLVEDLYIFEMTSDFNLESVRRVEKEKNVWELSTEFSRPQATAQYLKNIGGFDYAFTQASLDFATFKVCYLNAAGGKTVLGSIDYRNADLLISKKEMNGYASSVFPAKSGHVLIANKRSKERILELMLEKF